MANFIKEMFSDLWGFGFWGKMSALLLAVAMAGIAVLILILIDMCGYSHKEKVHIIGTDYTPAHTTMVAVPSGKTTILVPQHVPEAFYIKAQWNYDVYNCRSNQFYYTKVLEDSVEVKALGYFTSGLITSNEYCDGVEVTLK